MTAARYKFDDGQSYTTKCFPARPLLRRRKDGAGHWLVAYREAEEQKHTNVHRRTKESVKKQESSLVPVGNTLDEPFLLKLHCVDKPSHLYSVDVSEQTLNSVKPEDLKVFYNVAYIDASVNSLSLGSFSSFVSLKRLNLSLNGICNMTFDPSDFPHLEVYKGPAEEDDTQFRALEVLMLDDNKLTSGVFNSLTNLNRRTTFVMYRICNEGGVQNLCRLLRKRDLIAEEEALMAVALFPMLREIDIHSNPLTTQRSGDPPLLTHYLHDRLGITIKRKKTQEAVKLSLKMSINSEWQVEERIPKVSKKQMLMELSGPSETQEGQNSMDDTFPENTDHFFVTQSADVSEYESDLRADEKNTVGNDDNTEDDRIPEKFNCYKMLRDAKPNPEAVEPIGTALNSTDVNRQEYKEALSLLRDMKTKYKMVHERTMEQAASQMFQRETDRDTNLDGVQPPSTQTL
ncbi:hypothetical protein INR49_000608 [Caranx melampygus]|nr:hypothetical protein INR49_000608 [Caranx melampygus]